MGNFNLFTSPRAQHVESQLEPFNRLSKWPVTKPCYEEQARKALRRVGTSKKALLQKAGTPKKALLRAGTTSQVLLQAGTSSKALLQRAGKKSPTSRRQRKALLRKAGTSKSPTTRRQRKPCCEQAPQVKPCCEQAIQASPAMKSRHLEKPYNA